MIKGEVLEEIRKKDPVFAEFLQQFSDDSKKPGGNAEQLRISDDALDQANGGRDHDEPLYAVGDQVRFRAHPDEGGIGEVTEVIDVGSGFIVVVYFPELKSTVHGYDGAFIKA